MSLRTRRKSQTREALVQAVLNGSAEGLAFSSMSLRQITKEAGVVPAAFYRHFKDVEELGKVLVEEYLTLAITELRKNLFDMRSTGKPGQIKASVNSFFEIVDERPDYWKFLITERFGGSASVREAIKNQVVKLEKDLAKDLGSMPAFKQMPKQELLLLSRIGINMFLSWVPEWLEVSQLEDKVRTKERQRCLEESTHQAQMVFYGASNYTSVAKQSS